MKNLHWVLFIVISFFASQLHAAETAEQRIRMELAEHFPQFSVDAINKTPLPGLYEMTLGAQVVYIDESARYILSGDLLDLQTGVSVTKQRTKGLKAAKLNSLDEKDMIVFGEKDAQYTVTVFTDIECGYCRKLHEEIADYVKEGIRIRYLAYPRAGLGSDAAKVAESVWCSDDPNKAMTAAKQGGKVEEKTCDNPIAEHYALGQQFGISGTPALLLEDGEVVPGYIPAKRLVLALRERQTDKSD